MENSCFFHTLKRKSKENNIHGLQKVKKKKIKALSIVDFQTKNTWLCAPCWHAKPNAAKYRKHQSSVIFITLKDLLSMRLTVIDAIQQACWPVMKPGYREHFSAEFSLPSHEL